MRSASLIYIITRAHGLATHLLSDEEIDSMVKAKSFQFLIDLLSRTDYAAYLSSISREKLTAYNVERILATVYSERTYYLIRFTEGSLKEFMINYARRIEVENIRRILRAKFSGNPISLEDLIPIPHGYQEINFTAMVETPSIDTALDYIRVSIYSDANKYATVAKNVGSLIPLELYIENKYYNILLDICKQLPNSKDVIKAINTEMAIKNIYYIIGLKIIGAPSKILASTLASIKSGRIKDFANELIKLKFESIVDRLNVTSYRWIVKYIRDAIEEKDLNGIRIGCRRALRHYYNKIKTRKPLSFTFMLAYFSSVENEYFNLRAIVFGKYLNVKDEEIMKVIIK